MKINYTLLAVFAFLLISCNTINLISDNRKPSYSIQAGIGHGGIIENTDFKQTTGINADAFTGATKISPVLGAHVKFPVFKNDIETGIDFMSSSQSFKYNDNINAYTGTRDLTTSQFTLPITYNFNLMKRVMTGGLLSLKLGFAFQYNSVNIDNKSTQLPVYELNKLSNGMIFGVSSLPVHFKNGSKMGFTFDLYRGSRVYTDFYNKKEFEMPGSSFMKFALTYQFK